MCPCRGGRAWEGGEGRVQAERPTRTRPQGQGNGPEGERHTELDRSPCPGRRCPCGCPQQVDRLDHPLARGVARMAPGWLPTIMAGPAQPCPQRDETHHGSPQTWLVASRCTVRALSRGPPWPRPRRWCRARRSQHSRRRRPCHQEATRTVSSSFPSLR